MIFITMANICGNADSQLSQPAITKDILWQANF